MTSFSRREWIGGLGVALLAGSMPGVRAAEKKSWSGTPPRERIRQRYFPDVVLTTHEGRKVRFYEDLVKDKTVVINFMYSCCEGICPGVMNNLFKVEKQLAPRVGKDIYFYSLTLKPKEDTPEVLQKHAETLGIPRGWHLLTGTEGDIELLRRSLGFSDPDPDVDKDTSNHIGNLRFGNEPHMQWASCPGMSDVDWIVRLIRSVAGSARSESAEAGKSA